MKPNRKSPLSADRPRPWGAREVALLALLGALLFVGKTALAWLPNVEPVTLLILVYAAVLGWRALAPVCVYVLLEYLVWGFGLWSACYLYVWPLLVPLGRLFRRMQAPLGWAALSGGFGLAFGALCAPVYWAAGGGAAALAWWLGGLPFDLLHGLGNFVLALVLLRPCRRALERLSRGRA